MFDFLKRLVAPPAKPATRPARRKPSSPSARPPGNLPLPVSQVVEGNSEADWDLWQDSVDAFDSKMQPLARSARAIAEDSQAADIDPFSRVSKNSDL
jgi:hypothetical protein